LPDTKIRPETQTISRSYPQTTGELVHKFGRQLSQRIVQWHYVRYQENVTTPLKAHMREFNGAWQRLREREINNLSPKERAKFEQLRTEPQQEAFFLSRSFSNHAGGADFPVGQSSLADRLSITHQGASPLIAGLEELGAIKKTANAVTNSKAARYRWIAQ
jgi:hypothetical protein